MIGEITDSGSRLLSLMLFLPAVGAALLFFVPANRDLIAKAVALFIGITTFLLSLKALREFALVNGMQLTERIEWLPQFGAEYVLGVDGLSIWLVILTTFLSVIVIFASDSVHKLKRSYLGCLLVLETGMLGTFFALDGLTFYIFWEIMLIPMYFLIGVWGGGRRIYAAIKFVLYTAFGSLLMLVAIVYLAYTHEVQFGELSFYLGDWMKLRFSEQEELWLFSAFALAFAIKIPLFPLHTWLPDAHVEAPTGGSVILAGVLLKMGLYGLIRFGIPVFPNATVAAVPILGTLGLVGIIYGALVAWVQTDMKKLVAYSSVSHLGFCVFGYAALNLQGMQGCILQMLNHGVSTAALFLVVGVLYDRKHTRMIADYGGLAKKLPLFSFVFLVFTLSSIGLPLTNGFVGEFLILLGGFKRSYFAAAIAVLGVILGALYMLSLYRRVMFGAFDEKKNGDLTDLNLREALTFAPLLLLVFVIGLYPRPFLERTEIASRAHLEFLNSRVSDTHSDKRAAFAPNKAGKTSGGSIARRD